MTSLLWYAFPALGGDRGLLSDQQGVKAKKEDFW